MNLNLMKYLRQ